LYNLKNFYSKKRYKYHKQDNDFHWQQLYIDLEWKFFDFINDKDKKRETSVKKANTYETEAVFLNKDGKNNLASAHFYREALQIFQTLGGFDEKVKELKLKLQKSYQKGLENEMVQLTMPNFFEEEFRKDAEEFVKLFQDKSLEDILKILSSQKFFQSYTEWLEYAKDPKNQSSLSEILPVVEIEEGIMKGKYEGEDSIKRNAIHYYRIDYSNFIYFKLQKLFEFIQNKYPNFIQKLMDIIKQSSIISEERIPLIEHSLERFQNRDYISTIHILVFQIEGILRDLLLNMGEPQQKVLPNKDEFYLLGQILNRIRQSSQGDIHLIELLKFIEVYLVDNQGDNIRNLIAHGYFSLGNFNIVVAECLIFIILRLTLLKFEAR